MSVPVPSLGYVTSLATHLGNHTTTNNLNIDREFDPKPEINCSSIKK
jgi:hypothetical protein